ncbi:MAG: PTS sugar transporter subunit IIA [Endomicrobiales bacterium]
MITILIITHGDMGGEMLRTAEMIIGKQEAVQTLNLTPQDSLASMCKRTGDILQSIDGPEGTLILTDMLGGTPCNACLPFCTTCKVEIISGLNLYMLLSSFMNRTQLPLEELAEKVHNDGQRNIANAKEIFLKKLK